MPSALERLKKAANLQPVRKVVTLNDGTEFEFWRTPLTMAERERAQKSMQKAMTPTHLPCSCF